MENRAEKAERLHSFAIGQFHKYSTLKSDADVKQKFLNAVERVKDIQNIYRPHRKYKRKDAGPDDEQTRIRITLLEYGNKGNYILPMHLKSDLSMAKSSGEAGDPSKTNEGSSSAQRNESVRWCF